MGGDGGESGAHIPQNGSVGGGNRLIQPRPGPRSRAAGHLCRHRLHIPSTGGLCCSGKQLCTAKGSDGLCAMQGMLAPAIESYHMVLGLRPEDTFVAEMLTAALQEDGMASLPLDF